jgi:pyruvate/2-oxoglutarate dehydrogenase complex dihydrolipoamide dehydrogenase (E3) component
MMPEEVDVVVLGLGTSGEDLALQLLEAGLDVAGIEPQLVGGECPYWACIPSKMAIRAASLLAEARRVDGVAGQAQVTPDWSQVARRIREEATGGWDDTAAVARFESKGGRFVRGWGRLTGPRTVSAGDHSFTARLGVVISTGSKPAIPPIPGLAEVAYWTTHEAIAADPLPDSLIVLGGGAVGCELGQVFSRFGVEVTIVEGQDRLLPLEEPEASHVITAALEGDGIHLRTGARVEAAANRDGQIELTLEGGADISADRVLVATGRAVDLSKLGLAEAGIDAAARFVEVDDRMRAGDGIWAMGDVTGKAMFTHTAFHQSAVVAADILELDPPPIDYESLPRVIFTDPEVGAVGLSEMQARERGQDVAVAVKNVPSTFRGWLHDTDSQGLIKLVIDTENGTLAGATVVAPNGGEVLGLLSLAVHQKTPVDVLRNMTYAFPTFHGGIGEALGAYARGTGKVIDPGYTTSGYFD